MSDNVNPRSDQPDNTRDASASPLPLPPMSVPPPGVTDNPRTPGLAPGNETLAALREQVTPAATSFEVAEWMGSSEPGTGFTFPPDLNPKYATPEPPTGTAVKR